MYLLAQHFLEKEAVTDSSHCFLASSLTLNREMAPNKQLPFLQKETSVPSDGNFQKRETGFLQEIYMPVTTREELQEAMKWSARFHYSHFTQGSCTIRVTFRYFYQFLTSKEC